MTDEKKHWIEDDATRKRFWVYAKGDPPNGLGLTEDNVHEALLCNHVAEFDGDKTAAMECLKTYVKNKALIALGLQDAAHAEARAIAFCDVYAPDGTRISVTAREGALAGDVARNAVTLWDAVTYLAANGWSSAGGEMRPMRKAGKPAPVTKPTTKPTSGPPPPPMGNSEGAAGSAPPSVPPPPPSGNGGTAGNAPTTTGEILQTEFVKITAPKGKPVVEFWRPNRKYAEVRWQLGGAKLMKIAPTLLAAGWLGEHFDAVGEEYTLPIDVYWEPSKPDGKYKDITLIELR